MLPHNNTRRPHIAAMLDTTVIYLRHNLHKKLDVETYMCGHLQHLLTRVKVDPLLSPSSVCLLLVQRIMQQLKNERVRLSTSL